MINAIIKVEKLKADDEFFNAFGIEEEDVEPSLKRLNLEEDEEMKAILNEWENKSKEFLDSKKDETAKIMAAAAEFKARMEAEEKEAIAQKDAQVPTETPTEKTE
jgi:histidyl-tRNA synthetase